MSDTTPVSMFDETRRSEIQSQIDGVAPKRPDLSGLTHAELRKLKADIDRLLPESETLSDMDMPRELVAQFKRVKDLQDSVIDDDETPANQKAQVAGQVASTLQQLVKMQTDFYTSERFRSIENLMIDFMKSLPLDQARMFIKKYEETNK